VKKKKQTRLEQLVIEDDTGAYCFGPDHAIRPIMGSPSFGVTRFRIDSPYYTIEELKSFHKKLGKLLEGVE